MATKPKNVKLAKNGVDILNAIRNDASLSFQERVPVATQEDIKTYGSAVLNFPGLANEFLDALVNRIGKVILTSRLYKNPFAMLKKGMLDYGETIEEVYEPFLIQEGFIIRTPRGREVTEKAYKHLGKIKQNIQGGLF